MGKVIMSTATTVDGVADGFEWDVSDGGHDAASREQFRMQLIDSRTFDSGVTLLSYEPTRLG